MAKASKRSLTDTLGQAASMRAAADAGQLPLEPAAEKVREDMITTAIHIPARVHALLREVSFERARARGGRPSVSSVIADLVDANWTALEKEAKR